MRRGWLGWLLAGMLLLGGATSAEAQEVQVPLDAEGRVTAVDAKLARRLELFVDEYPGFLEARLFRGADGDYVLEVTRRSNGEVVRERREMTAPEVERLRERVGALAQVRGVGQEGRYVLLAQSTLVGATFYGWAVPYALGADGEASGGLYLLTASASFFVPYALTEGRPVGFGPANLSRYGITRGIAHGALLHNLVAGEPEREHYCDDFGYCYTDYDHDPDRTRMATALLGSVAEGVGGYLWARNEAMTPGEANAIVLGGDLGLLWGLGAAEIAGVYGERGRAAIALPAAAAGILAGRRFGQERDLTWGDADVLYTAAALGGWTGLALHGASNPDDFANDGLAAAAAMAGSAAALWVMERHVRDTDFTIGQSSLNRLGTLAGALAGASLGVVAESEAAALLGSAAGAALGFAGTFGGLAEAARHQDGEQAPGWKLTLSPQALLLDRLRGGDGRGAPVPVLEVRYRF